MEPIPEEIEKIVTQIIDAAYNVHAYTGNGLLESAYEACMLIELEKKGLTVENQILLPIIYDGHIIPNAYRLDILVNKCVIVEIKVVEDILPVHISQVLTYLRFTDLRIGLIINFNKKYFGDAVRRVKRK
ncbi:conserved hypothetical protein [Methanocella paludicola SANAE]|uniref:GxxExxY protein n=1 Tax=Methanocella paludicola (strain DSM 17711 / JCM 13418 / NBRC 101707 / SANAE) TaxID=304371 RepID=D1YVU4_METPS|nr:GxxExxY protein [Methanocella paludicola]BAI60566.1 conserved hypothetical protein [Methanocella paludicola SANAE]BAI62013.1 conserved hypothetical protein [Methanocella paludicola SANAE]